MSIILPASGLRTVYHEAEYSDTEFRSELERVHKATEVDRKWLAESDLPTYETDKEICTSFRRGNLERVVEGAGFLAIDRLYKWAPPRSDPGHKFYYSPPFLHPKAAKLGRSVAELWQHEMGDGRMLSFTSMIRSNAYQKKLAKMSRKLTISDEGLLSSHQAGIAFDIDGCGLVETTDRGAIRKINPRNPGFQPGLVNESRMILLDLLTPLHAEGTINMVEELPGTQEHCFHICVNPEASI